jgi:hypothetical protein
VTLQKLAASFLGMIIVPILVIWFIYILNWKNTATMVTQFYCSTPCRYTWTIALCSSCESGCSVQS